VTPETVQLFVDIYRDAVGEVTAPVMTWLTGTAGEYPVEWFRAAVDEACASTTTPNPGYISRILERWLSAGRMDDKPKRTEEVYHRYNINLATMKREEV
jgi:hypothetical protein